MQRFFSFSGLTALATGLLLCGLVIGQAQQGSTCPLTPIYWSRNPEHWPLTHMTLGKQSYSDTVLHALLNSRRYGTASMTLARQLIAAKLNIANGALAAPVTEMITHADRLLSEYNTTLPFFVRHDSPAGEEMISAAEVLNDYNYGLLTTDCTR